MNVGRIWIKRLLISKLRLEWSGSDEMNMHAPTCTWPLLLTPRTSMTSGFLQMHSEFNYLSYEQTNFAISDLQEGSKLQKDAGPAGCSAANSVRFVDDTMSSDPAPTFTCQLCSSKRRTRLVAGSHRRMLEASVSCCIDFGIPEKCEQNHRATAHPSTVWVRAQAVVWLLWKSLLQI